MSEYSIDDLYEGLQLFKEYVQANFPFKWTQYIGAINPSEDGFSANVPAVYAQISESNLVKLWVKIGISDTAWGAIGGSGSGSGIVPWQANHEYNSFSSDSIPTLVWDSTSLKIYYNTSDFTSGDTFEDDLEDARWVEVGASPGSNPRIISNPSSGNLALPNNFDGIYLTGSPQSSPLNITVYMDSVITFQGRELYFYTDYDVNLAFNAGPSGTYTVKEGQMLILKAFGDNWYYVRNTSESSGSNVDYVDVIGPTSFTAEKNKSYLCYAEEGDTASITIELPDNFEEDDFFEVTRKGSVDLGDYLTVETDGQEVEGNTDNINIDLQDTVFRFVKREYDWIIIASGVGLEPPPPYELPIASNSRLGGIKVGDNLSITEDGILSAEAQAPGVYMPSLVPAGPPLADPTVISGQTIIVSDDEAPGQELSYGAKTNITIPINSTGRHAMEVVILGYESNSATCGLEFSTLDFSKQVAIAWTGNSWTALLVQNGGIVGAVDLEGKLSARGAIVVNTDTGGVEVWVNGIRCTTGDFAPDGLADSWFTGQEEIQPLAVIVNPNTVFHGQVGIVTAGPVMRYSYGDATDCGGLQIGGGNNSLEDSELQQIKSVSGDSYTLSVNDLGTILEFKDNSVKTLNIPDGLPIGFKVKLVNWAPGYINCTTDTETMGYNIYQVGQSPGDWGILTKLASTTWFLELPKSSGTLSASSIFNDSTVSGGSVKDALNSLGTSVTDLSTSKLDVVDYVQHFKGKFSSLSALQSEYPTAGLGDYAIVDAGSGVNAREYIWDEDEGWVDSGDIKTGTTTDQITEGSSNLYFVAQRVQDVLLTGLSTATNAAISETNKVIEAFGKLQAQINTRLRFDNAQTLSSGEKTQAQTNLGLGTISTQNSSNVSITGGSITGTRVIETVSQLTNASGTVNVDLSLGNMFTITLSSNVTSLTFTNLPGSGKGQTICIRIFQNGTGGYTFALPASFKAIVGSDTAIQAGANAGTIIMATTVDNGTRWEYSMKGVAA